MSFEPCAAVVASPRIVAETFIEGYFPPLLLLSTVRSVGGTLSALAAGPPPLPSVPWQTAQYAMYISLPDTGDVGLTATCLMVLAGALWSCPETKSAQPQRNAAVMIPIAFFPNIAFLLCTTCFDAEQARSLRQQRRGCSTLRHYGVATFHSLPLRASASVDLVGSP